jgi:hypothetical protein
MEARESEARNVVRYFQDNPVHIFTGGGFGTTTPMYEDTYVYAPDGSMHHAHISAVIYALRHGLIGVLLLYMLFAVWLYLIAKCFSSIRDNPNTNFRGNVFFSLACFGFIFAASFKSQILYDSSSPLILAGLLSVARTYRLTLRPRIATYPNAKSYI